MDCNNGLLSINCGLLWGIGACCFGLLGFPGGLHSRHSGTRFQSKRYPFWRKRASEGPRAVLGCSWHDVSWSLFLCRRSCRVCKVRPVLNVACGGKLSSLQQNWATRAPHLPATLPQPSLLASNIWGPKDHIKM